MEMTAHRSSTTSITGVLRRDAALHWQPDQLAGTAPAGARRPVVLAHRGLVAPSSPENTVGAVRAALAAGADGVEIDVRLTADGVLVCSHDDLVGGHHDLVRGHHDLVGGRDDGSLRARRPVSVAASTVAELRVATRHRPWPVATAAEVLLALSRAGGARVVIEAKPVAGVAAAEAVAAGLRRVLAGASGLEATVSSFDPALVSALGGRLGPVARTALLGREDEPGHVVLRRALAARAHEVHLHHSSVRAAPHLVGIAHRLGLAVTAWTVNRPDDMTWLCSVGVDGLITDDVRAARAVARVAQPAARTSVREVG